MCDVQNSGVKFAYTLGAGPKPVCHQFTGANFTWNKLEDIMRKIFPCDNKFQILAKNAKMATHMPIFGQNSISRTKGLRELILIPKCSQ